MKKYLAGMLLSCCFIWFGSGHGIFPVIFLPWFFLSNLQFAGYAFADDFAASGGTVLFTLGFFLLVAGLLIKQHRAFTITAIAGIVALTASFTFFLFSTTLLSFWLTYAGFLIFIFFAARFILLLYANKKTGT